MSAADARRNWTPELLLRLATTYRRVVRAHPTMGRLARMQLVYEEFARAADCSHRSRKAVDDKLYSMKQMYHFIVKMNGNLRVGQRRGVPSWFELTKDERRAVRALHRVRIPNISLEVFRVLDSVLNPAPLVMHDADQIQDGAGAALGEMSDAAASELAGQMPDVVDAKRNWSDDVTLELAKAWNAVHRDNRDLRGATLSYQVYNVFMAAVGFSNRSRKAVDDKMHSMREMYRFIRAYETEREAGEDKPTWFDLPKKERRELRALHKIRVPNLTREVYHEIEQLMTRSSLEPEAEDGSAFDPPTSAVSADQQTEDDTLAVQHAELSGAAHRTGSERIGAAAPGQPSVESQVAPQPHQGPPVSREAQLERATSSSTITSEASAGPAGKRRRTDREASSSQASEHLDASAVRVLREEFGAMLAAEREERRRQHAEQMSVLREIAALLRQRP